MFTTNLTNSVSATYPDGRTLQYTYDKRGNRTGLDVTVAFNGVQANGQKKGIDTIINDLVNTGKVNGNKDGLRENIQATLIGYGQQGNKTGLENTILSCVNGYTVHLADYTYNNANQLITANYPITPITYSYTYDKNGNMTGDGFKTYEYDSENRLTKITDKTKTITYTYDDKGYRTSTAVNGNKTYFHYDDGKVAYETDGSGTITKKYTYDAEGRLLSFNYAGISYFYNFNGHGDIIGLTDASGNQVAGYTYDAYGNIAELTGDIGLAKANPYRYASYRYDDETGLYYLISRYYDPNAGRFITKDTLIADPMQPITQNLYVYTGNNPVNFTDPDGHSFKSWLKSKAESFLGVKNDLVNGFNKLTSSVNAKINNALSSVVSGFSRAKTTVIKVKNQAIKLIKTGPSKIKAVFRGAKATVLRNFNNARKSFTRVQKKAIASLKRSFDKEKVRIPGIAKQVRKFTSLVAKKYVAPFVAGFGYEVLNDASLSIGGRILKSANPYFDESKEPASFQLGRMVGSLTGMYLGMNEMRAGAGMIAGGGGITVLSGGVLVEVGGPVAAAGVGAVALGGATTAYSGYRFSKATDDFITQIRSSSGSSGGGIRNTYKSLNDAPQFPKDFKPVQNGTKKVNINDKNLLKELREVEPGKWKKVYKDGYSNGRKVSIHYFESPSGRVFDIQVKPKWSNASSGR